MKTSIKIKHCRICGSDKLHPFLNLGSIPLPNGFLKSNQLKAEEPKYPLEVGVCLHCSLMQLMDLVNPEVMFHNYVYIPSGSKTRLKNFQQIANEMISQSSPGKGSLAVDIGSNDGSLLLEFKRQGIKTLGVDPAKNLAKIAELKGIETLNDYFNLKTARKIRQKYGSAHYITATNVVAHIGDLHQLFSAISHLLDDQGLFVCEFPYVVDLLEKKLFDTIYQEHLSYFSVQAFIYLIKKHDLKIIKVRRTPIDGGALRFMLAKQSSHHSEDKASIKKLVELENKLKLDQFITYQKFADQVQQLRRDIQFAFKKLKHQNKSIAGYGASARGNILLNYCGINHKDIDFIVDSTLYKQGLYTPGHHIPIYPEEKLLEKMPDYTLILAWNFAEEIMKKQKKYRQQGGKFIIPVPEVKIQ